MFFLFTLFFFRRKEEGTCCPTVSPDCPSERETILYLLRIDNSSLRRGQRDVGSPKVPIVGQIVQSTEPSHRLGPRHGRHHLGRQGSTTTTASVNESPARIPDPVSAAPWAAAASAHHHDQQREHIHAQRRPVLQRRPGVVVGGRDTAAEPAVHSDLADCQRW